MRVVNRRWISGAIVEGNSGPHHERLQREKAMQEQSDQMPDGTVRVR
jgi:hypothetical protein